MCIHLASLFLQLEPVKKNSKNSNEVENFRKYHLFFLKLCAIIYDTCNVSH